MENVLSLFLLYHINCTVPNFHCITSYCMKCAKNYAYFQFKCAIQLAYKYSEVSLFLVFFSSSVLKQSLRNVFTLWTSRLGLISSMRLDGRKDTQFVKSVWSILHSELKTHILPLLVQNNKGRTNTHTHIHIFKFSVQEISSLKKVLTKNFPIFFRELYVKFFMRDL